MKYDVLVIGAGLAGLESALVLKEGNSELNVLVLEARDRVGGRTFNKTLPADFPQSELAVDGGAQFVGPTHSNVLEKVQKYNLQTLPVFTDGKILLSLDNKITTSTGAIPSVGILSLLDLGRNISKLNKLAELIHLEQPWKSPNAARLDATTVFQWSEKESFTKQTKRLLAIAVKAVFGCETCEISMLYFLFYIKSNQSIEYLTEVENGAQEKIIKGGTQQISQRMAEDFGSEFIKLNHIVTNIDYSEDNAISIGCNNGEEFSANRVVIAIPPPVVARIHFHPPLPYKRQQLNVRMIMTPMIKFQAYYSHSFWRDLKFDGTMNSDCSQPNSIVSDTMDYCQRDSSENLVPCIVGFIGGNEAIQTTIEKTKEERKELVARQFARMLNTEKALDMIHYEETNWLEDDLQNGTLAIMPPNVMTMFGSSLWESIGPIYWAGTETATHFNGYMDGALSSGKRVAHEILEIIAATK